jgi:hypothetical protein
VSANGHRPSRSSNFNEISKQVHEACRSHGCFHVRIRHPTSGNISSKPISSLAKRQTEIEHEIESLFSPSFLKGALSTAIDVSSTNPKDWEDICNGSIKVASFIDSRGHVQTSTFRGRSAESGDEENAIPEPKLSWEYQRCCLTNKSQTTTEACNDTAVNERWNLLSQWTEVLHFVAATVIHLLGIPPDLALKEQTCNCLHNGQERKCNIDLLRVFRYDALESNESALGSSAHSDWGTLTVVWQDDKGGLQTYCDACDEWSDVNASVGSWNNESGGNLSSSSSSCDDTVNLFIHVGDFLSLSAMQNNGPSIWHSPRHRVLCPIRSTKDTSSNALNLDQCRRSLVYFAYPPPGISLKRVQTVVGPIATSKGDISNTNPNFNMYSVLHDQSKTTASNGQESAEMNATAAYEKMLNLPFDEVIAKKWNQVQRKINANV